MSSDEKKPEAAPRRSRRPRGAGFGSLRKAKLDSQASQVAVCILEVLAGLKKPSDSAAALGVSVPRYYALESRALEGMVEACRARPKGPPKSAEREVAKLKVEVERLERECQRSQALLRAAQRAVGLSQSKKKKEAEPRGKRRRKPVARALKAISVLEEIRVASERGAGDNRVKEN